MPPLHKPLKNDGPACRVCGCTESNACPVISWPKGRAQVGCSWMPVEPNSPPLCSACSGTAADMAEAITRGMQELRRPGVKAADRAVEIGQAALDRQKAREKIEAKKRGRKR